MTNPHAHDGCAGDCPMAGAVDRRRFLMQAGIAAAAAALAACAGGGDSPTAPTSGSATLTLANYPALASVGGVALVTASGSPIAVVRTAESTFVALSRVCPHQGTTVSQTTTGFRCPNHGATFDKAGNWTGGQRTSDLREYPVAYDAQAGTLTVG